MKTETLRLPESWASYLFNNDSEGMEQKELDALHATLRDNEVKQTPLDFKDCGFCRFHDAFNHYPFAATCADFVFEVKS